jgi:hypothetical protein
MEEEYWRDHEYATPFELLILAKDHETEEKYLKRRELNLLLMIAFKHLNEEKTYT